MVFILRCLLILAIVSYSHSCTYNDYPCSEKSRAEQKKYFATKTPYDCVSPKKIDLPGLSPVQMFAVVRQGMTWPSDKRLEEWIRCDVYKYKITADVRNFREIDVPLYQIKSLAERIRKAFYPGVFYQPYNSEYYKVSTRPEEICKDTGRLFLNYLFKSNTDEPEWENDNQSLMIAELDESDSKNMHIDEIEKFKRSHVMMNVLKRVETRMGLKPGELNADFVSHAYDVCRFERSFNKESYPPSCDLFCQEDLKALEYMEDLFWYYTAGYGNPMVSQQVCPMARRFLETFNKKTDGSDPLGVYHFGNAQNIFNMYVMLGLAKDGIPLKGNNYIDMVTRKWRSSSMVPRNANFMAVLFKGDDDELSVAFYFNENRMLITLGKHDTCEVCAWTKIQKLLTKYIKKNCST